jgi:hypothetical protein
MSQITIPYMYDYLEVQFTYTKGWGGSREEPPEPENLEIEEITYKNIDVSNIVDIDIVTENVWDHITMSNYDKD